MKVFVFMTLFLSFAANASQNPCVGSSGANVRLTMAQAAGNGLSNANSFGMAGATSLYDAKEAKAVKGVQTVTVELRDGIEDTSKSFFYKSTIDLKKCQVLKVEVVSGL